MTQFFDNLVVAYFLGQPVYLQTARSLWIPNVHQQQYIARCFLHVMYRFYYSDIDLRLYGVRGYFWRFMFRAAAAKNNSD